MEKTGEHKNLSYAKSLVKFAKDKRNELIEKEIFNAETDVIIVIFDLDIFNAKVKDIDEIFKEEDDHLIFGFTNPEFGLFLLLHIKDSYNLSFCFLNLFEAIILKAVKSLKDLKFCTFTPISIFFLLLQVYYTTYLSYVNIYT